MAPTLTAAVQQQTRVLLTLTWPGIQTATIQRLDPDGVLRNVRNAEPVVCLGSCAAFDHEAPLDVPVTYRATSPQGSGTVLTDAFARTVGAGSWGSADTGQSYTTAGTAADFSVGSGVGKIQPSANNSDRAVYGDIGSSDFDIYGDVSLPSLPASGTLQTGLIGRVAATNTYYRTRLVIDTAGAMSLVISMVVGGSGTAPTPTALGTTYVANTFYRMRFRGQGSTLQSKIWLSSAAEPAAWNLTTTDTSITAGTGAGCVARNETAAVTQVFSFDNLLVNSLAPLTVTGSTVTSPSGGQAWLTHPGHPQYAGLATVTRDGLTELRPARRGVFTPIGTSLPVVVNDVRSGSAGTLIVQTSIASDVTRLRNMLTDGMPLLLRQPLTWGGDAWWISVGDVDINRFTQIATDGWRRWTLPYTRVDRPAGSSDGAVGQTWNDVKATYATWNALAATGKTWTALAQSVT